MPKKIKPEEIKPEVSSEKVETKVETAESLLADGWIETPEIRLGGVRVFEKIIDGVREYKEI